MRSNNRVTLIDIHYFNSSLTIVNRKNIAEAAKRSIFLLRSLWYWNLLEYVKPFAVLTPTHTVPSGFTPSPPGPASPVVDTA